MQHCAAFHLGLHCFEKYSFLDFLLKLWPNGSDWASQGVGCTSTYIALKRSLYYPSPDCWVSDGAREGTGCSLFAKVLVKGFPDYKGLSN